MKKIIVATHNDRFHADDVFAMATLQLTFPGAIKKVYRTRDQKIFNKADIVFDVGNVYDSKNNRFDHHQTKGAGKRKNGIPFASFGLVWKKFGKKLCGSRRVADQVDKKLVQPTDAGDNGFSIYSQKLDDIKPYSIDRFFHALGSTWKEKENYDKAFFEAVKIAKKVLEREIIYAKHTSEAFKYIEKAYKKAKDKKILILDEYYPWSDFATNHKNIMFVVYPNKTEKYFKIQAVADKNFKNRKDFPKKWAGLRDFELEKATGIKGAKFCHKGLFLTVADTKETAIALTRLALKK